MTLGGSCGRSQVATLAGGHASPDATRLPLEAVDTALVHYWADTASAKGQVAISRVVLASVVSLGEVLARWGNWGLVNSLQEFTVIGSLSSAAVKETFVQSNRSLRSVMSAVANKINLIHKNQKTQIHEKQKPPSPGSLDGFALSTKGNGIAE